MTHSYNEALICLTKISVKNDTDTVLNDNVSECLKTINITYYSIINSSQLLNIQFEGIDSNDIRWKFICTSCYIVLNLIDVTNGDEPEAQNIIQQKTIRSILQFIITFGISPSLLPGIGVPSDNKNICSHKIVSKELSVLEKYSRIKSVCKFLNKINDQQDLGSILTTHFLGDYLAALFQLCYAPLVKPNVTIVVSETETFIMTEELWLKLQNERKYFQSILDNLIKTAYQPHLIKELVILQGNKDPPPPNFMKKALSKHLSSRLLAPNGLNSLIKCFLDSANIDIGAQWEQIDMITRLISVRHGSLSDAAYLNNICKQLEQIMQGDVKNDYLVVIIACLKCLYEKYNNVPCIETLIDILISPLLFKNCVDSLPGSVILFPSDIIKSINTIDVCFTHPKLCLPSHFLSKIIYSLFHIRIVVNGNLTLQSKLNNLIFYHYTTLSCERDNWFSSLIYRNPNVDIMPSKNVIFENSTQGVVAKHKVHDSVFPNVKNALDCLLNLIKEVKDSDSLARGLFVYLLSIIIKSKSHIDVVENESKIAMYEITENYLMVTKALESLISMDSVLKGFENDPYSILQLIMTYLEECANNLENDSEHLNNDDCISICFTLISTLLGGCLESKKTSEFLPQIKKLSSILNKSSSEAIKLLTTEILRLFNNSSKKKNKNSQFEDAISEVCDSLLPVRTHGLMQLTKLIDQNDPETVSKKHYVMYIYQENLKDEDSYVYLTAINGLSSMATLCTEDVLETLSKEFVRESNIDCQVNVQEDVIKLRMKIGETLVKITKKLGENALAHKNILLNTFLCGCRDPDDFIRASSLSNLAELARVLSYKLGSILFEILTCVHSIIQFDKSSECRRASVLVISSLIKGLGKDSLFCLKDALLPMYRTLRQLYKDENEDSVVRLHAQIALEELNSIMEELLSPYLMGKS